MSIRDATFELCKAIAPLPKQDEIRQALIGLNNTHIGTLGDQHHAQVYSFLMLDQERVRLAKRHRALEVNPLATDIRDKLAGYQAEIFEINSRCGLPLKKVRPNCNENVLSPYSLLAPLKIPPFSKFEYFPEDSVNKLVEAFHKSPWLQLAIDTSSAFDVTFSPEHYVQEISQLEELIHREPIDKRPTQLRDTMDFPDPTSLRWIRTQHLSAVLGLRGSLGIVNQLLYSKLFSNKLLCLDKEDIISFGVYAFATGGSKLVFQTGPISFLSTPGDVLIVKDVPPDDKDKYFCRIERLNYDLMPGQPGYIELRTLDEHFNPYGILFEPFL